MNVKGEMDNVEFEIINEVNPKNSQSNSPEIILDITMIEPIRAVILKQKQGMTLEFDCEISEKPNN